MEEIIKFAVTQGGISGLFYIIWYYTFRQSNRQHQQNFEQNKETFSKLIHIIEEDTKYKELLAGHLSEIKTELKFLQKEKRCNYEQ